MCSWTARARRSAASAGCSRTSPGEVGPDAYTAGRVAVAAGLPTSVPANTVNRLCGSGRQAIRSAAAMEMRWNDLELIVAGDESMPRWSTAR